MAKKSAAKAKKKSKSARKPRKAPKADFRAKIRMYRHGLGDCFLITLPRSGSGARNTYTIMIDCGVILGTSEPAAIMTKVMEDIVATTGGEIDLLVVTHEHWDHLSGFIQARDAFANLKVHDLWLAWTEDPKDALANKLRREHDNALAALQLSAARMELAGDSEGAGQIGGLLEFFGAAKGSTTKDALASVKAKVAQPRYCRPQDDPVEIPGTNVRVYAMGPPPDEKKLKKINPSKRDQETYGLALDGLALFLDDATPALRDEVSARPFSTLFEIPFPVAGEMDFFKQQYWRPGTAEDDWRRIDTTWLDQASELALQLDSLTNNTSLVLAFELADGEVLLFVADAQVGNWLSWQELSWTVKGKKVTGPDLLERAIFYKVGHHGSHNATLKALGVELMKKLRVAMIPVNEAMAKKKQWNHMPLPELVETLQEKAKGGVFRSDKDAPRTREHVVSEELFFELTL